MSSIVIPDYVVPFEAWRVWRIRNGRLVSQFDPCIWEPREVHKAVCNRMFWTQAMAPHQSHVHAPHEAPLEDCSCGLHGAKDLADALKRANLLGHVVGKVALWGKIVEGPVGFKAQYAYPVELWIENGYVSHFAGIIGRLYGVPVHGGRPTHE